MVEAGKPAITDGLWNGVLPIAGGAIEGGWWGGDDHLHLHGSALLEISINLVFRNVKASIGI